MASFDAESYLRALGERSLLTPAASRRFGLLLSPIESPARALVFVGALDTVTAAQVIDDYGLVEAARDVDGGFRHRRRASRFVGTSRPARPLRRTPPRAFALGRQLEFGGGTLTLDELFVERQSATLNYHWVSTDPSRRRRNRFYQRPGSYPWGNATPAIVDNAGNAPVVSGGSGGGNDDHWQGQLNLTGALARDLRWIEFNDTRIALTPSSASPQNRVEPLPPQSPAELFLWRMLAAADGPFVRNFEIGPVLDAFVAAGVIELGDSTWSAVQATADALPEHRHEVFFGGSRRTRLDDRIPERWRSLLSRIGATDGPVRNITFGVSSPVFDDRRATIAQFGSEESSFSLEVTLSPGSDRSMLDQLPVAWWARDDRGNHYLGGPNGWHVSDESEGGTLAFWPALDPRATALELLIEADTERAVIAIDLTDHSPAGAEPAAATDPSFANAPDPGTDPDWIF